MHNMKTIEVVAAVIIRDGEVFATQRGYGEFQGWWEFPGGKSLHVYTVDYNSIVPCVSAAGLLT